MADGIMVARGDMGVEIDFTEIPVIQKDMIAQCVAVGKPVITATQMLDSMMKIPPHPGGDHGRGQCHLRRHLGHHALRRDGAGKYPVEAVRTMDAIALRTESDINYTKRMRTADSESGSPSPQPRPTPPAPPRRTSGLTPF